ncbi:MAG: LysR family transcriptional regulator [Candidatus Competibacterales bacterium]
MDLLNLKLLVRAAALENLSAAGRELGLSPAAASARLGVLERDLGARLLQRTTRRVTPTADGERFLVHARLVVAELEAARAAIGRGASEPQGSLGVAASASFGRRHILPLIPQFMARFPKLTLELQLTDQLVNLVDQAMDVGIRTGALADSSLVAKRLAPAHRVVCAAPSYLERFGHPTTPQALQGHNRLLLMGHHRWLFADGGEPVAVTVTGNLQADSGEALREACLAGLGVTLLSTWNIHRELEA